MQQAPWTPTAPDRTLDTDQLHLQRADGPPVPFVKLPVPLIFAPISPAAKATYGALLAYAKYARRCYPGHARLMADLGCSINSVTRYLAELRDAGWIHVRRRGHTLRNIYTLYDRPTPPPEQLPLPAVTPKICEPAFPKSAAHDSQNLRRNITTDAVERESQQQSAGAGDVVALLLAQGLSRRVAEKLATSHTAEEIRRQVDYHRHRTLTTNPAGALVTAIREHWPPPAEWTARQRDPRGTFVPGAGWIPRYPQRA